MSKKIINKFIYCWGFYKSDVVRPVHVSQESVRWGKGGHNEVNGT